MPCKTTDENFARKRSPVSRRAISHDCESNSAWVLVTEVSVAASKRLPVVGALVTVGVYIAWLGHAFLVPAW